MELSATDAAAGDGATPSPSTATALATTSRGAAFASASIRMSTSRRAAPSLDGSSLCVIVIVAARCTTRETTSAWVMTGFAPAAAISTMVSTKFAQWANEIGFAGSSIATPDKT